MKVNIIKECGYSEALLGLSLSYDQDITRMVDVARKLYVRGSSGETKFLESIVVWLDITAPRFWWQQFSTYRIGVSTQSSSTMHTILRRPLEQHDFEMSIDEFTLERLNSLVSIKDWLTLKNELPEGFLQRRIVCTNYKTLNHIIRQRNAHRLPEWATFIVAVIDQAEHRELLPPVFAGKESV